MLWGNKLNTSPSRVLILGGAGWKNVGDDLIACALKEWAGVDGATVKIVGGPFPHDNAEYGLKLAGDARSRARLAWEILQADYVLIGGGGLLDDRMPNFYRPFTRAAFLCRLLKTPYAFAGIGVGPIQNEETKAAYRAAAEGAARVLVRDEMSRERLRASGVKRNIEVTPDPVLWGTTSPAESSRRFDLAINLRNWHTNENPKVGYDGPSDTEITHSVAKAVNEVFDVSRKIALVSMSGQPGDNDAAVLATLAPMLNAETETFFDSTPAEVQTAISQASSVLAMRLHACLLGAKAGSKVLGLAYDPKVAQQGTTVGFDAIQLDGEFITTGANRISQMLRSREEVVRPALKPPLVPWRTSE
ncbi:polysaccharide pyruvyl transferase family protein [Arthrobacter sp. NQ4]|uniref:polysaccharide pyruvyl transferase family protein n=1 Tax=Arthrobacter sp. NQ4 TaxID=3027930 RepID=UPI0023B05F32|nr:polysaccharide pyruvyl transferase family protein [Arthrobacter sp. NQ4]MDE8585915.1 polysaccharide pyruvyl transferase family protein [Arthrobacter sp. NQ4]